MIQTQAQAQTVQTIALVHAQNVSRTDQGSAGSSFGNAMSGMRAAKYRNMKTNSARPGVGPAEKPRSRTAGVNEIRTSARNNFRRCFAQTARDVAE